MRARGWLCCALLIGVAGCSGGGSSPTLPDPSSPTTSGPANAMEAIAAFRDCLSQHGVDAPELTIEADGSLHLSALAAADLAGQPSILGACGDPIVEAGLLDLSGQPELAAAVLADLRTFAECMRAQGIDGFPDPNPDFTGIGSAFDRDQIPFGFDGYSDAYDTCSNAIPAAAG